jgi:AraC-like DNA-binding protein
MEHERPYLKPRYALADLAASTGIPYYYLSAVINQEYGWNFNDYINWFRVKYVKDLMVKPEVNQYTLEGVAQMAGFGSRATFARAFHRFEGCTPTEYLKRHFQAQGES